MEATDNWVVIVISIDNQSVVLSKIVNQAGNYTCVIKTNFSFNFSITFYYPTWQPCVISLVKMKRTTIYTITVNYLDRKKQYTTKLKYA